MSARSQVQRPHGMGEEVATVLGADGPTQRARDSVDDQLPARDPHAARVSPDPMQGTDRYRLVMPYTQRL